MLQAVFARMLQSADKFCWIFPCKMSEFSMFCKKFGCMHACILHVLSVRLTRVPQNYWFTAKIDEQSERVAKKIQERLLELKLCLESKEDLKLLLKV